MRAEIARIAREKFPNLNLDEINKLVDKVMTRIHDGMCNCQCHKDIEAAVDDAAQK